MSTSDETKGPIAALMLPTTNLALLKFARAVYAALLDNPSFPSPSPALPVFAADIDAFEQAETKAATRAKGAATQRDARKKTVKDDLFHLCDYVQSVVEKNTNPADAAAMIESAFMSVRKVPRRPQPPELHAKNTDVSGKVALRAKAVAPMAIYAWEYSVDQSTWIPVAGTTQSRVEVSGLTSAKVYYFRFRAQTRAGLRDYSQVVSLVVQ